MNFEEDSLVLALGRAIKAEETAEKAFAKFHGSFDARRRIAAEDRYIAARKKREAAEGELVEYRSKGHRASGLRLAEREEMRELLHARGFDKRDAERLQDEGMGPIELNGRLRQAPGSVGSLEYTHNLKRKS